MALIDTQTTLIHLPIPVSSISIRNHQISDSYNADFCIGERLIPQKDRLTHLTIDELDILYYKDIQFSVLTYLTIDYPSDAFPPLTTAAAHLAQHFFDTNQLDSFFLNVNDVTLPSLHRFTHVKSLYLFSSSLSPLDLLQSIVCLHHIESLDVLNILRCSSDELDMLIDSACRLNKLKMKFDRSFRIPSQISSLILDNNDRLIPSDILSHQISSVRTLQIEVKSKEMIIDIIDRLDHLDSIVL